MRDKPKLEVCRGSLENYQIGTTPLPQNKEARANLFKKTSIWKLASLLKNIYLDSCKASLKIVGGLIWLDPNLKKSQISTTLFPLKPCVTKKEMLSQISTSLPTVGLNYKMNFSGLFFLYSYWYVIAIGMEMEGGRHFVRLEIKTRIVYNLIFHPWQSVHQQQQPLEHWFENWSWIVEIEIPPTRYHLVQSRRGRWQGNGVQIDFVTVFFHPDVTF